MLLSKKRGWKILFIILIGIFIILSMYRYKQVNEPFKNYRVIEIMEKQDKSFLVNDLTYTLGNPIVKDEGEYIYYELPVSIENKSNKVHVVPYDSFHIRSNETNNMLDRELFLAHPDNKKRDIGGIAPSDSDEIVIIFTMQMEWGIDINTRADFYFLEFNGDEAIKHRFAINY